MSKHWTIIHHNPAYRQQRLSKCVLIALTSTAHFLICSTNWMCIKFSEHFIIFFPRNWSHVLAHIFLRLDIFVTPWQSQSVKERKHHITYNLISILSVVRKFSHSFHLKSYVVKHRSTYGWTADGNSFFPLSPSSVSTQYFCKKEFRSLNLLHISDGFIHKNWSKSHCEWCSQAHNIKLAFMEFICPFQTI